MRAFVVAAFITPIPSRQSLMTASRSLTPAAARMLLRLLPPRLQVNEGASAALIGSLLACC